MPVLIRNNTIVDDEWCFNASSNESADPNAVMSLADWQGHGGSAGGAVQIEPGDDWQKVRDGLSSLALIAVYFQIFTDGRGFSVARELRDLGYRGELRARGHFLPDQVHFLHRCGFDAFQPDDENRLIVCLEHLQGFSEHYQASATQPLPLFRRRG